MFDHFGDFRKKRNVRIKFSHLVVLLCGVIDQGIELIDAIGKRNILGTDIVTATAADTHVSAEASFIIIDLVQYLEAHP